MFTKMSELIHDVVKFVMKTMFGIMMGLNVIQGLVVPITSQLESSAIIKLSGAIPGVGSTISSVTSTILLAGNLVKNSVGAVGIIAVLFYCGIPLLRLVVNRFGFQFIGALIQPVSDSRITACIIDLCCFCWLYDVCGFYCIDKCDDICKVNICSKSS